MSNTIVIELCPEDRARLDRLAEALERKACDKCVATAMECMKTCQQQNIEPDPIAEAARKALGLADTKESPVEPQEEAEAPTLTTAPPEEEKPAEEAPAAEPTEPTVTHADVKALYIKLSASGKKEEAKAIILPVSSTISGIPEDKLVECYNKLAALEE